MCIIYYNSCVNPLYFIKKNVYTFLQKKKKSTYDFDLFVCKSFEMIPFKKQMICIIHVTKVSLVIFNTIVKFKGKNAAKSTKKIEAAPDFYFVHLKSKSNSRNFFFFFLLPNLIQFNFLELVSKNFFFFTCFTLDMCAVFQSDFCGKTFKPTALTFSVLFSQLVLADKAKIINSARFFVSLIHHLNRFAMVMHLYGYKFVCVCGVQYKFYFFFTSSICFTVCNQVFQMWENRFQLYSMCNMQCIYRLSTTWHIKSGESSFLVFFVPFSITLISIRSIHFVFVFFSKSFNTFHIHFITYNSIFEYSLEFFDRVL